MVKPQALWALFKSCDNSKYLGDICRALGGQNVTLTNEQRYMLQVLKCDNEWHSEAITERKEAQRQRQARYRERQAQEEQNNAPAPDNLPAPAQNPKEQKPAPATVARRTVAETVNVDLSKVDISDDAFFSGEFDAVLMARKVTGDMGTGAGKFWRKWIEEHGEAAFLETLFQFKREIQAGEDVENRGAAFTQRLKRWSGSKSEKA